MPAHDAERALEPVGERLARQLLGDVELKPLARVLDQLDRGPQRARVGARRRRRSSSSAGRCCGRDPRRPRPRQRGRRTTARRAAAPGRAPRSRRGGERAGSARSTRSRPACAPCADTARARPRRAPRAPRRRASPRARTAASSSAHGSRRAHLARQRGPGERSAPARSAAPSSPASSRGALGVPERQPRARAAPSRAPTPSASSSAATSSTRRRIEAHELAARADRRQHLDQPVGEQDQVHERRRLLERLQHPVGRLVAELVDALDHEHAPLGLERRLARRRDHRPVDVADEDLVGAARRDPGQVGMRAGRARAPARRPGRRDPSASSSAATARAAARLPAPPGPWNR